MGTSTSRLSIRNLASCGGDGEGAHAPAQWIGDSVVYDVESATEQACTQGGGQREKSAAEGGEVSVLDAFSLISTVSHMTLMNPDNWCFANAAVYSLLWTTLSHSEFGHFSWGKQCNEISSFLERMSDSTGNLSNEDWFRDVLRCWGRSELAQLQGSISQRDAAEFVQVWLDSMHSGAFDMAWECRLEENGVTLHVVDRCSSTMPLFFQFEPLDLQVPSFDLSSLASRWHQVDGMWAGLIHLPSCLCIHLDRCVQRPGLSVVKCDCAFSPKSDIAHGTCLRPLPLVLPRTVLNINLELRGAFLSSLTSLLCGVILFMRCILLFCSMKHTLHFKVKIIFVCYSVLEKSVSADFCRATMLGSTSQVPMSSQSLSPMAAPMQTVPMSTQSLSAKAVPPQDVKHDGHLLGSDGLRAL
eukprot:s3610_g1.t1